MEVNCKNELWVNLHSPIYNFKFFSLDLKGFHIFPGWKSTYQCAHIYYWNPLKNPGPPRGCSNSMKNGYEINFGFIYFFFFQFFNFLIFFSILIILFIGYLFQGGNVLLTEKSLPMPPYLGLIHQSLRRFTGSLVLWPAKKGLL